MLTWQMLPHGLETEVTFEVEDDEAWKDFQTKGLGVAGQRELPMSLRTIQNEAKVSKGSESEITRKRHLSLPETYFAVTNSILLYDQSLQELWERFQSSSANFARNLAVYHHFRYLGYTPKSGLNYGAHYVLYQGSIARSHSEYIVYVHDEEKALPWSTIQSLTRIAADVKKIVLLCTVTIATKPDKESNTNDPETNLTFGKYNFHGIQHTVEAIAIRFWDATLAEKLQSYTFQYPSVFPKKVKPTKRKSANLQI